MTIAATIDQSAVDAYLDRINRFVANVSKFQERLNSMLSKYMNDNAGQAMPLQEAPQPAIEKRTPVEETHIQAEMPEKMQEEASTAKVTPEDIDLDALLNSINLDGTSLGY